MGAPSVAAAQFANFMMLAILSIHSILAGLAVGVSGSASGFGILIALRVHKVCVCVCVCVCAHAIN